LRWLCAPGLVRQERLRADCADAWFHLSLPAEIPAAAKRRLPATAETGGGVPTASQYLAMGWAIDLNLLATIPVARK
jgi:hypothetical protein